MDITKQIQSLQDQLTKLSSSVDSLTQNFYKNNFATHQDFTKSSNFSTSLKVPSYSTLPACETGQICESSGKLYICSATDTWTIVGTQS